MVAVPLGHCHARTDGACDKMDRFCVERCPTATSAAPVLAAKSASFTNPSNGPAWPDGTCPPTSGLVANHNHYASLTRARMDGLVN
jgi:hypothetical protein